MDEMNESIHEELKEESLPVDIEESNQDEIVQLEQENVKSEEIQIEDTSDAQEEGKDEVLEKIESIELQQVKLLDEFKLRLSMDQHKNEIIDRLHSELQQHKEGFVEKIQKPIFMALISFIDDLRKTTERLQAQNIDKEAVLREYKKTGDFMEDLLFNFGIEAYVSEVGSDFNPKEQKCVLKTPINIQDKHRTIVNTISPGYKWDEKVIKLESIELNIFKEE
ncbi:nucleotide exchange factor GrpE [Marinifilum fragile]|uniref:nucleotide exchange factor GrpE n=1 Tax=Marinifilum fragile TaxID=570161 RepID=UPI0006D2BDD9|nr:nucleotide exchange factor GrpE [Marinifilum fragile]